MGREPARFAERGYAVVFAQYGAPQSFEELTQLLVTCLRCLWSKTGMSGKQMNGPWPAAGRREGKGHLCCEPARAGAISQV